MSLDPMVAREQLKSVVERIERLEEEKKAIADDIRDVYAEAKAKERQEEEAVRDLYLVALGMLPEFEAQSDAPQTEEAADE